jgi:O-acetyl-ADP-ribose deacetylase (regulator of RNase III)
MDAGPLERLVLVDVSAAVCSAWRESFAGYPEVSVVHGRFEDLPDYDCMVAAANSYGIMDGGVDAAIRDRFPGVEERVQERIRTKFHGYQPVGTSIIVPTDDLVHPWIAHTPTMRIPSPLTGESVVNVHTAMWAMLCAVRRHNRSSQEVIGTVACPGLATAHGRVPPPRAAHLMALAYGDHHRSPVQGAWRSAGIIPPSWARERPLHSPSRPELADHTQLRILNPPVLFWV